MRANATVVNISMIVFWFFVLLGCNRAEQEIVVVPSGYIDRVLIVYDQADGADPLYREGKRVHIIPSNGILKTKMSPNPGWIGTPEFYKDTILANRRFLYESDPRKLPVDAVVAYGGSAGYTTVKNQEIRFLEYYIGNKAQIDSAYEETQKLDFRKLIR